MYINVSIINDRTGNSHLFFIIRQVPGEVDFMLDTFVYNITVWLDEHFYTSKSQVNYQLYTLVILFTKIFIKTSPTMTAVTLLVVFIEIFLIYTEYFPKYYTRDCFYAQANNLTSKEQII